MITYKKSGVDVDAGNKLVKRIKKIAPEIGGFSGLFPLTKRDAQESILVASTDGVGTKLKIAQLFNKHNTVGIDLVAMCVNDIITSGAKPLFFLDYFATGKLNVRLAEQVIKGINKGCHQSNCILLGGETAEMPGFYKPGEYDLAGFCVGIIPKNKLIKTDTIKSSDVIIGLPSNGVHSNGFSLIRKIFSKNELNKYVAEFLKPTRIYVQPILSLLNKNEIQQKSDNIVKGIAHITGGGFIDNIPRILPKNCQAVIQQDSWNIPIIFKVIQEKAKLNDSEMFRTFNMGIGMILVVKSQGVDKVLKYLPQSKVIGKIVKGKREVKFNHGNIPAVLLHKTKR